MAIDLKIQHNVIEQLRAAELYYQQRTKGPVMDKLVALLLLLTGVVSTWLAGVYWWTLTWFVLAPLEFFNCLSIRPLLIRYRFKQSPEAQGIYYLSFTEDGIAFKTNDIDSKLQWSIYGDVIEDEALILLIYGAWQYSVIPKRCFKDEQELAALSNLLQSKIKAE